MGSVKTDVNESPFGHASEHARHDRLLVVRFAARDALASEMDDARRLIEQCADCASLAADIGMLRTSLADLPTPRRTRNFRISAEQAEQLHGSAFDRFLRRLSMPGMGMLRPVAGVALALGLTITVVGAGLPSTYLAPAGPPGFLQEDTSGQPAATDDLTGPDGRTAAGDAPTPAAAANASAPPADAVETDKGGESGLPLASPESDRTPPDETGNVAVAPGSPTGGPTFREELPTPIAEDAAVDTTRLLLIYGGVTLATLAFAVLLLAIYARRHNEDPLLR